MLLGSAALAVCWSVLALACIIAGGLWDRLTLRWHGALYLSLATLVSGAAGAAGAMALGSASGFSGVPANAWLPVLAVVLGYAAALRYARQEVPGKIYLGFSMTVSALLVWHATGLAAGALTGAVHQIEDPAARSAYCATARTAAITLCAIALAWSATRWRQSVLSYLVYPMMLLGAYKLAVQDLRAKRTMALFLSLLLYGGALIVLPRLLPKSR